MNLDYKTYLYTNHLNEKIDQYNQWFRDRYTTHIDEPHVTEDYARTLLEFMERDIQEHTPEEQRLLEEAYNKLNER